MCTKKKSSPIAGHDLPAYVGAHDIAKTAEVTCWVIKADCNIIRLKHAVPAGANNKKDLKLFDLSLDTTEKVISAIAGLLAIAGAVAYFIRRSGSDPTEPNGSSTNTNSQNVTVTIGHQPGSTTAATPTSTPPSVPDLKRSTHILFVDDDRGFKIVGVLKKMGWEHAKLVTDIGSLEQQALVEAQVVFVDIQGVGRMMRYNDEGLGLALAIKRRYPAKKVVIYSAEEKGARFHEALQEADYSLPKTAEPIRFEDTIVRVLTK